MTTFWRGFFRGFERASIIGAPITLALAAYLIWRLL